MLFAFIVYSDRQDGFEKPGTFNQTNAGGKMKTCKHQRGGSPVLTLIVVAVLGYVVFVGVQYVPHWLEARSVSSILNSVEETYASNRSGSKQDIEAQVIRMLQVNEMHDMTENFSVSGNSGGYTVSFRWDRTLNLGFETRTLNFERTVSL